MFFNKSKIQQVGKLTDKEIADAEELYKKNAGIQLAINTLSCSLGQLEQDRLDWWDKVTDTHMIEYDKTSECLSYDSDGTINKKRK